MPLSKAHQEQVILYTSEFLDDTLPGLHNQWSYVTTDPGQDEATELPNTVGFDEVAEMVMNSKRKSTPSARVSRVRLQLLKTMEKMGRLIKTIGPIPRDSDMYEIAADFQSRFNHWMATPIEVVTCDDFNKIGTFGGEETKQNPYAQRLTNHTPAPTQTTPNITNFALDLRPEDFMEETPTTNQALDPPDDSQHQDSTPDLSSFFAAAEALNNGTLEDDEDEETTAPTHNPPTQNIHNFALDLGL